MEVIVVVKDKCSLNDDGEGESSEFREVDADTARAAYKKALGSLGLTPEELLVGKVDDDGEIIWSGCPRWLFKHPRTLLTVDGIINDIFGPESSSVDRQSRENGGKRQ
jgi:hypothetical protein